VLGGAVVPRLEALLRDAAPCIDCGIMYIALQPDHVHLFVAAPPTLTQDQIMLRLKGYTSRYLRQEFATLHKMPTLWTQSSFCGTMGMVSSATIQRYIEEQGGK
jgi:putative transposase